MGAWSGRARAGRGCGGVRAAAGVDVRSGPAPGRRPDRAAPPGRRRRSGRRAEGDRARAADRAAEARNETPLLALDLTFRPQASLTVLWALGDPQTRRVIERAHERAIILAWRWLEDDVAETRRASGRGREKTPALVVAAFRHFDNRDGFPLLHERCLALDRVQRLDDRGEPKWGALDTTRLFKHVVAAGTLCTLAITTEVCEELGLATVPRERVRRPYRPRRRRCGGPGVGLPRKR
ncbi:MobF family relaxase [Streptomyces cyaneofuscatus]|uniref:MobF family relaxase n=1 Tax=Streptomyces cyaneofuscatus TaxID=66883 RepID=UPI0036561EA0